MLQSALSTSVAVRARWVWSKSYAVCVCGDGCVMPTTKPGKVYPVFAWEVLFVCVCDWGGCSQDSVGGERNYGTVIENCVYVCAHCKVVQRGWKG